MERDLLDINLEPFIEEIQDELLEHTYKKCNSNILIKLFLVYLSKLFNPESPKLQFELPPINIDNIKYRCNDQYSGRVERNLLNNVKQCLLEQMVEWSSFRIKSIDLTMIESFCNVSAQNIMGMDDKKRMEMLIQKKEKIMTEEQQQLFLKLPSPVINSLDFTFGRKVLYLFSYKLASYLRYSKTHEEDILEFFSQEHIRILTALYGIQKPVRASWIPKMTYCSEELYIIGIYFGADSENELDLQNIDWNFYVNFFVLEKLLDVANSFFEFYKE